MVRGVSNPFSLVGGGSLNLLRADPVISLKKGDAPRWGGSEASLIF